MSDRDKTDFELLTLTGYKRLLAERDSARLEATDAKKRMWTIGKEADAGAARLRIAQEALEGIDAWMIALGALEGSPDWRAWLKRVRDALRALAEPPGETTGSDDGRTSRECPNNPGRQCLDYDDAGNERSGRCVYACAIDNDRLAAPAGPDSTPPADPTPFQRYQAQREEHIKHKAACHRCPPDAQGNGCDVERALYEATRDALRACHQSPDQPHATPPSTRGTASVFVTGKHPTCPACGSIVLPDGKCVNGCTPRDSTPPCTCEIWTQDDRKCPKHKGELYREKYASRDSTPEILKRRTPEELAAHPRLTKEAIDGAIAKGERARRIALGIEQASRDSTRGAACARTSTTTKGKPMPTMRERLRNLAKWLDEGGIGFDGAAKDAETALLRTLATRMDELERDVADRWRALSNSVELGYLRTNHGEGESQHREISDLSAALARLDAPVTP